MIGYSEVLGDYGHWLEKVWVVKHGAQPCRTQTSDQDCSVKASVLSHFIAEWEKSCTFGVGGDPATNKVIPSHVPHE